MNETTFFTVCGCLAVISLASGIIGWQYAKHQEKKRGKPSTFRDLYEDNAPTARTPREIADEYASDCGSFDYPFK